MFWLRNKKNIFRYTLLSGVLLMLDPIYEIWKKSVEKCYVSTKKKDRQMNRQMDELKTKEP